MNSTPVTVVRVRKAGDENLYDPTYLVDPTRDELLELISDMGDVNINYFYQYTVTGSFARRSRASKDSVLMPRQVDPTLPPIVIVYTRKDGIEKSWVVRPTYNELLDVVNEMGDSLEIAVNVGPARRSR